MPDENKCPQCGTPLPTGTLTGMCPACLLKLGAAADTVTDAKQAAFHPPSIAELAPLFPQLEILELIGKGGMGAVYKARQKQLDRIVALKILPPGIGHDAAFAERFTREAKALAKLNHPGIVTLYEFGQTAAAQTPDARPQTQLYFFLMEFVDGVNLRQLLQAGRISAREALAIVPQICDALQFAHDQGIVHRDIKPENILLDRRGRVKVADFGLAKIVGAERSAEHCSAVDAPNTPAAEQCSALLTDVGKVMGTPQYMSPEQRDHPGEVDNRADIYALGVVFYQMLTGELPGKKLEAPSKKVQIDVRLDQIVLRALEKNPELRYQQVSEVKTGVEKIVATPPGSSRREEAKTEKAQIPDLKSQITPRLSRTAIIGAGAIPFFVWITTLLAFAPRDIPFPSQFNSAWISAFLFGFAGIFFTTILGWIAVAQIRRSAGKLYGLGLAVFDGLFFPLLLLDVLIVFFWLSTVNFFARLPHWPLFSDLPNGVLWLLVTGGSVALANWFIIHRVWRAVNAGSSRGGDTQTEITEKNNRKNAAPFSRLQKAVMVAMTIIGAIIVWFYTDSHSTTAAVQLTQAEFLNKFHSNEIAHASINIESPSLPLNSITGTFFQSDEGGTVSKIETSFVVSNAWLKPEDINELLKSGKVRMIVPNSVKLQNVLVSLLPFVILIVCFLGILGITAYLVWRWIKRPVVSGIPAAQTPDHFWRWFAVGILALISIPIVIAVIGLLAAIAIPNFVKARARAQENAQQAAYSYEAKKMTAPHPEPNAVREIKVAPFVAGLPDGGSIELFAVQTYPATNSPWWQPDGSPSKFGADIALSDEYKLGRSVLALAQVKWPAGADGKNLSLPNGQHFAMQNGHRLPLENFCILTFEQPFDTNQPTTLYLQIGVGEWQTLATKKPRVFGNWFAGDDEKEWSFSQTATGAAKVTIDHLLDQPEGEFSFVAVDTDGKEHRSSFVSTTHSAREIYTKYEVIFDRIGTVAPLLFKNLRAVRLQSRPYQQIEFRNVSLQPGHATTVAVKDFGGENETKLVQNSPAQKISAFEKTIMLTRATNRLVGETTDTRTVDVWSDSALLPGEKFRQITRQPDGEIVATVASLFARAKAGKVGTSTSFTWWFKEADGFGALEAEAATAQIREHWTQTPQRFEASVPREVFCVTNQHGATLAGSIELVHEVPQPPDASGQIKATAQIKRFRDSDSIPGIGFMAEVPAGYTLRATSNYGEGSLNSPSGPDDYSVTWFPMNYGARHPASAAVSWNLKHAPSGNAPRWPSEPSEKFEIILGQPRLILSITNSPDDVFQGFLELVGPEKPGKN